MGAGEQAQCRRSAFTWPWLLPPQPGAGMGGARSTLKASAAERLLLPTAWLGARQGENSGQVPHGTWNSLTKRGGLERAPGGFHVLVPERWKSLFSAGKSRTKQEFGRKLFRQQPPWALHLCPFCPAPPSFSVQICSSTKRSEEERPYAAMVALQPILCW